MLDLGGGTHYLNKNSCMMKKSVVFLALFSLFYAQSAFALDDRFFSQQTYLSNIGYAEYLKRQSEGSGTIVAVIDSGVWLSQSDLQGNIWLNSKEIPQNSIDDDNNGHVDDYYGWNFIDGNSDMQAKSGHATNIAGIIAAQHDTIGIAGIAPKAKIMSLIACNTDGTCSTSAVQNAIKYAVDNGAGVINLSLGAHGYLGYSSSYDSYIKYAYDHDVVVVAAAGNGDVEAPGAFGQDLSFMKASPICNESNGINMIIGVGATDASWSNYGACVDILAPGVQIMTSTVPAFSDGYGYELVSGTSFSAPMVSAAAALLRAKYPRLKNWEVMDILLSSSAKSRLNIATALDYSRPRCTINDIQPKQVSANGSVVISGTHIDSLFLPRLTGDEGGFSYSQLLGSQAIFLDANRIQLNLSSLNLSSGKYKIIDGGSACDVIGASFQVTGGSEQLSLVSTPVEPAVVGMATGTAVPTPLKTYDKQLTQRLLGNILLQTESHGEAWYLNPSNGIRYYLQDGFAAYSIMRSLGQGIADKDLNKIPVSNTTEDIKKATNICSSNALANRMKGKILLQVQQHGEAWYIYPKNCRRIYLKDGDAAYQAMRYLGLGIKNSDIDKIPVSN